LSTTTSGVEETLMYVIFHPKGHGHYPSIKVKMSQHRELQCLNPFKNYLAIP